MTLPVRVTKLFLTAHIVFSVGWLGAAAAYLAIGVVGLVSDDEETVRGAYLVMDSAAPFTLVPLSVASLLTGVVQSLGTRWGLFRHYWVIFKLAINVFSTAVLVLYLSTFAEMARAAGAGDASVDSIRNPSPVVHAAIALALLLLATVLAIYKPKGRTTYGRRHRAAP